MESIVLTIAGRPGVGNLLMLEQFCNAYPHPVQIIRPRRAGDTFRSDVVDWGHYEAVAIDEVLTWNNASVVAGILALEAESFRRGKKLIVVTYGDRDLWRSGFVLRGRHVHLRLEACPAPQCITRDGRRLHFQFIASPPCLSEGMHHA